ncbi:Uncharacterised protein at_DN1866, partial [Pycnogonum litorale]
MTTTEDSTTTEMKSKDSPTTTISSNVTTTSEGTEETSNVTERSTDVETMKPKMTTKIVIGPKEEDMKPTLMPAEQRTCYNASNPLMYVVEYDNEIVLYPPGGLSTGPGPGDDRAILLNATECLKTNDETPSYIRECISYPENCRDGFTLSLWVKVDYMKSSCKEITILTTGGDLSKPNNPGIHLFVSNGTLTCVLNSGRNIWKTESFGLFEPGVWTNIGIGWTHDTGLKIHVQNVQVTSKVSPSASADATPGSLKDLMIGCDTETTSSSEIKHNKECGKLWIGAFAFWNDSDTTDDIDERLAGCEAGTNECTSSDCNSEAVAKKGQLLAQGFSQDGKGIMAEESIEFFDDAIKAMMMTGKSSVQVILEESETKEVKESSLQKETENLVHSAEAVAFMTIAETAEDLTKITSQQYNLLTLASSRLCVANNVQDLLDYATKMAKSGKMQINQIENVEDDTFLSLIAGSLSQVKRMADINGNIDLYNGKTGSSGKILINLRKILGNANDVIAVAASFGIPLQKKEGVCADEENSAILDVVSVSVRVADEYGHWLLTVEFNVEKTTSTSRKMKNLYHKDRKVKRLVCVRWDDSIQVNAVQNGAWTTDGVRTVRVSENYYRCESEVAGKIAMRAILKPKFNIPEEEDWLKYLKWVGYGLSCLLLVFYILTIFTKENLHEMFHLVRFNTACAALGGLSCFFSTEFVRHHDNEEACKVLGGFLQFFYTAVACWLVVEAHALFGAVISGVVSGKVRWYLPMAWGVPAIIVGSEVAIFKDYGDDYMCMTGHDPVLRWLFFGPIIGISILALIWVCIVCCNVGTPAIRKEYVTGELTNATRSLFCVCVIFLLTWIFAPLAYIDLNLDIPSFYPIFLILNSCLGIILVVFMGVGSKHFRRCVCGKGVPTSPPKSVHLDPLSVGFKDANEFVKGKRKML